MTRDCERSSEVQSKKALFSRQTSKMAGKLLLCIIIALSCSGTLQEQYKLKKVLMLSRHNVRTPLGKDLEEITSKPWPKWKEQSGYLTAKGAMLEGYMGVFFSKWLNKQGMLPDKCPDEDVFYAYANVKQRTRESAKSFVENAFPGCNITVHSKYPALRDPVFYPIIHNDTESFKAAALQAMSERLSTVVYLNKSMIELESILDYESSDNCRTKKQCDLIEDKNVLNLDAGEKPGPVGPLKIGNSAVDAFNMQYYEGLPMEDIAWGAIKTQHQFTELQLIAKEFHNVCFNTSLIAKDISKYLVQYMKKVLLSETPKVTLMMGHDANIFTLQETLGFKPYVLPLQHEYTPVGGKIVFQKWYDADKDVDLLRIDYVYQSHEQLRNATKLGLNNPPQFFLMELKECPINSKGYCLWDDFVKLLNNV